MLAPSICCAGLGKNIVSSADLVAQFESTWTDEQIESHFAARDSIDAIVADSFKEIGKRVRNGGTNEHEIQQWFMEAFERENILTDDPPIVAVNANAGNPHYEPHASRPVPIREGDLVLLDVWGKKNTPGATYYDITWMGFVGSRPSARMQEIFHIVRDARDAGVKTVIDAINFGTPHRRMGSRSRHPRTHPESRLRRLFHSSHRTFHRHRRPFQWRQHGRS